MALTATIHRVEISLSDVDRGVYESLDLRLAQHPSETTRYLLTRLLAYCLCHEEGIAFSKGGLSDTDEPPVSVRDREGSLLHWIDVGVPSAERLHKASKAARTVSVFTSAPLAQLQKEAATKAIHRVEAIHVYRIDPGILDAIGERMDRTTKLEITRNDGQLYVVVDGMTLEATMVPDSLVPAA